MHLKIIFYNCQSANANLHQIKSLLTNCDVLCLQETFLCSDKFHVLENLSLDFCVIQTQAIRKLDQFNGRASGGLAIFVRKNESYKIYTEFISERCMGVKITCGSISYLLLNVYLNCDYGTTESLVEFRNNLAIISNHINTVNYDDLILIGDFNSDPYKGRFFKELLRFSNNHELVCADVDNLSTDSFTFISRNDHCGTSFIDHVFASRSDITSNHSILYGFTSEDHIPISCEILIPLINENDNVVYDVYEKPVFEFYLWDQASEYQLDECNLNLEFLCEILTSDSKSVR